MSWFEIDENLVDEIDSGEFDYSGEFKVESEVAKVKVDSAYLTKSQGGALAFNIKFVKENGSFIDMQEWIKSGDEKGNKSTYTDKKTGSERPLPGVNNMLHFLKIVGEDIKSIGEPKTFTMKVFGKNEGVKVFEKLRGKTLIVANQAYEDDYNDEIKTRTKVVEFMDLEGKNYKGKERKQYWEDKFVKEPVKLLKKKVEQKKEETDASLDAW